MEFTPHKYGQYLLLQRLAAGGMSEVYRGIATGAGKFHKQVAIKRILPAFSDDQQFEQMFEYEAHLASRLSHSNIVEVYDFVKLDDTYLLAMEFIEGKNARQLLGKLKGTGAPPRLELGLYIVSEVCKGLEYAHSRKDALSGEPWKIVHRDISPENIMISYEGDVKIVDFGIARAKDRVQVTHPDMIKGKLGYLSPERALGAPLDHRTDIFSAGLVLYELLTGQRVFPQEDLNEALRRIEHCIIPAPSELRPEIGAELEMLILKALAKDPADRFATAAEFHRELQLYLGAYYPSFLQKDVSDVMGQLFERERQDSRRGWEAACREAAALTLAELESSIGLEPQPVVNRTAGVSGASASRGPGGARTVVRPPAEDGEVTRIQDISQLLNGAQTDAGSAHPTEEASHDRSEVTLPSALRPAPDVAPPSDADEAESPTSTSLHYMPFASEVESATDGSGASRSAGGSFSEFPLPTADSSEPSITGSTDLAKRPELTKTLIVNAKPEPVSDDATRILTTSELSAGDRSEPSVNLLPRESPDPNRHELSGDIPKSATATSAAIERGADLLPPPPPPTKREPVQELGRYLAIGTMLGLLGLFLVHRWSRIHHVVAEPDKLPEFVNQPVPPVTPQPSEPPDPHGQLTAEPPEPSIPTPPIESQPVPVTPPPEPPRRPKRIVATHHGGKGRIEIRTNKSAELFIDNHPYGRVRANRPLVLSLSSDRKHRLHFVSPSSGVDAIRTVSVTPGHVSHKSFTFQVLARKKSGRRPANH